MTSTLDRVPADLELLAPALHTRESVVALASRLSPWQRVLHGNCHDEHARVAGFICDARGVKAGFRYAACGRGDRLYKQGDRVGVQSRGCGHRMCPRCGRLRGLKVVRRVKAALSSREHGFLYHMVCTRKVDPTLTCKEACDWISGASGRFVQYLRKTHGASAGVTTLHCVWSGRSKGWHAHAHVFVEFPNEPRVPDVVHWWRKESRGNPEASVNLHSGLFLRLVATPGPAVCFESANEDFWSESRDAVCNAIEYPLRDILGGTRLESTSRIPDERLSEYVASMYSVKGTRTWGRWRTTDLSVSGDKTDSSPVSPVGDQTTADTAGERVFYGSPDLVFRLAASGNRTYAELVAGLERSCRNNSKVGVRLVSLCRNTIGHDLFIERGG